MPAKAVIQHRRDTEANWAGEVLASGEIGYVTTGSNAGNLKIGDGSTAWGSLPFVRTFPETITASTGLTKSGSDIRAVFGTSNTTVLRGDHAGLTTGVQVAEQLAAQGVSAAEAQKGYATIANVLPTAQKLSEIYGGTMDTYGQGQAEQEVFNQLASAQRARERLTAREVAQFGGTSGVGRTSLSSGSGQI